MSGLRKNEIQNLINANPVLKNAYKAFRNKHPYNEVIDMWSMSHFNSNIEEAYIKYNSAGTIKKFEYFEEV